MTSPAPRTDAPALLVVDLDGTLIRTDMLFETYWSALGSSWLTPVSTLRGLLGGRAGLKRALSDLADVDPALLPYNEDVLSLIRDWRKNGGEAVLVTASDQKIADQIAGHLGLFDAAHGSDGQTNLGGRAKSEHLSRAYPDRSITYVADRAADLPVWKICDAAVTVGARAGLRRAVDALGIEARHIAPPAPSGVAYLKALRPHQWLKNGLIFVPMLAAQQFDANTLLASILAFAAFSLVASSVYIVNDLIDLAADRAHPRKRLRPFASGAVPIAHGTIMAPAILVLGLLLAITLGGAFVMTLAAYYLLTLAYSLRLKRIAILDICTLAGLYTIRIVAGGTATGIELSVWLLAFSMFFFFALAGIKRQAELGDAVARGVLHISGRGYQASDLPVVSQITTAAGLVAVLVLALYVDNQTVNGLYGHPKMLWGVCVVMLYWMGRMMLVTHRGEMHDDPLVFAAKDKVSLVCLAAMATLFAGAVL